jgi:hypothetical protein
VPDSPFSSVIFVSELRAKRPTNHGDNVQRILVPQGGCCGVPCPHVPEKISQLVVFYLTLDSARTPNNAFEGLSENPCERACTGFSESACKLLPCW